MKIPGRSSRSLFVTVLLAGVSVAYVFFVFLPAQKAIGKLRRELDAKQQYIVDADRLSHAIQLANRDLEQAEKFTAAWRETAPDDDEMAAMLGCLTAEAEASELTIRRLDQRPIDHLEEIGRAPVTLECVGDFRQVFELVRRLEAMPQDLWITHLRVERSQKDSENVSAELVLEVFADNSDISN